MHDFAGYRPGNLAGVVGLRAGRFTRESGFDIAFEARSAIDRRQGDASKQLFLRPARGRA